MKSLLWRVWAPFDFVCVVFVFRVCFGRLGSVLFGWCLFVFCFWAFLGLPRLRFGLFVFFVFGACLGSPRLRFALFLFVCLSVCLFLGLSWVAVAPFGFVFVCSCFCTCGPCGPCLPLGPYNSSYILASSCWLLKYQVTCTHRTFATIIIG